MKRVLLILIVPLLLITTGCTTDKYVKEISIKELKKAIDNKETFILEIMRDDCSACESFNPRLKEIANEYKIKIKTINTNKNKLDGITDVSATPTIVFFTEGVEESVSTRIEGAVSKDKLVTRLKAMGYIK